MHKAQEEFRTTESSLTIYYPVSDSEERQRLLGFLERANKIARTANLNDLLRDMLGLMTESCGGESATLYLFDPQTDEMVISAVHGDDESKGLIGLRLKKHMGIVGAAVSEHQPIIVGDLPSDPRWLHVIDPTQSDRLRNAITLPLVLEDHLIGAAQIFNYQRAELDLLDVLGNRLITELDRLVTFKTSQQSNMRLRALIDILGQVAGTMDRDHLLRLVTEHASQLVSAERSSIFLVDPDTNDLAFQVSYQSPGEQDTVGHSSSEQEYIYDVIRLNQAARKSDHGKRLDSKSQSGFGFATRSAITAPLQSATISTGTQKNVDGRTIGGLMALNRVNGDFDDQDVRLLEILADQASTFLQAAELYENANDLFLDVIKALVAAIDAKDPYTQGHSLRVSDYSVAIAQELGLNDELINDIRIGSLLHDVGKIGVPDYILKKRDHLTEDEFDLIKDHPLIGNTIMEQVRVLQPVLPAIAEHHERLNGSGYPRGLHDEQISLIGRIVAVADVFDAMISERPYRPPIDEKAVLIYLKENTSTLFDPQCVAALVRVVQENKVANPTLYS